MPDNKTENKTNKNAGNQEIDWLAPLDEFKMPADDPMQEAGSRAAIHGDLKEAPYPAAKNKGKKG